MCITKSFVVTVILKFVKSLKHYIEYYLIVGDKKNSVNNNFVFNSQFVGTWKLFNQTRSWICIEIEIPYYRIRGLSKIKRYTHSDHSWVISVSFPIKFVSGFTTDYISTIYITTIPSLVHS